MSYFRLQSFERPEQEFKGPLYHINTRGRTREEAFDNLRVLIPEFAKAEKHVERLKREVKRLKAELAEKNPKNPPNRHKKVDRREKTG